MKITKLVRDKIPEKFTGWIMVKTNKDQLIDYINKKVIEEASEVANATTKEELVNELADLFEICNKLMKEKNIKLSDVKIAQKNKNKKNGSFNKDIVLTFDKK